MARAVPDVQLQRPSNPCNAQPIWQEYTNYHFEVAPAHLRGALERFAQFFVAPLCKQSAMEREVGRLGWVKLVGLVGLEARCMELTPPPPPLPPALGLRG